ncbi:MAG: exo-beta-N-acetylmuramidase NamZ family protein [Thermoproteota archaeon]
MRVKTGLDSLLKNKSLLRRLVNKNIGLVINHTSLTSELELSYSHLLEKGIVVKAIFTPEHGLWGAYGAGMPVESGNLLGDTRVYSLYGAQTKPDTEMLDGLDTIVYDIQDVGCRTYTYISTMFNCLFEASKHDISFMVLDRPNPLGGAIVEGPVLKKGLESFVGPYHLPLRYAMTPGELSLLYASDNGLNPPEVVRMQGWMRKMYYVDTGMPWIYPSPAIPTPTTALLYSGMVLLEATNLSEGRGTYKPFETFGAPWLNSTKLVSILKTRLGNKCRVFEVRFIPSSSKYEEELCKGVHLVVEDFEKARPFEIAMHVLQAVSEIHPKEFEVNCERMDRLLGDGDIRKKILSGVNAEEISLKLRKEQKKFKVRARKFFLYN